MASAAAVAANKALDSHQFKIGKDTGEPGEVISAIRSQERDPDTIVQEEDEGDDDDDVPNTARRRGGAVIGDVETDEGDNLFGDEGEVEEQVPGGPAKRLLDDEELDSGDEIDRLDRVLDTAEEGPAEGETQEKIVMDVEMPRQPLPEPSDGEMYLLKIPPFLEIEPTEWDHQSFQPPTTEHHANGNPTGTFSAYNTAMTTIRWRHSPSNPSELQSNARILRWSDGSLTLQLASDPTVQYEIDGNALAPPQRNPLKPTPTSVQGGTKGGRQGTGVVLGEKYESAKDAFTYLLAPHATTSTLRVVQKITAGLSVKQPENVTDEAVERLEAALVNAANATRVNGASGFELKLVDEDPEAARRKAEQAMREAEARRRKHENAIAREAERSNRALGRSGLSSGRYGGLNAGMLEEDEVDAGLAGSGRGRLRAGATPKKRSKRRSSVYSSDEDMGRRHFRPSKEDEYEVDDFVAGSDEEEEVVDDDDDDSDDGIVEESRGARRREREEEGEEDGEGDAPGEVVDEEEGGQARIKRRRVVDEDEEE